jgi:class 3 adenylate cyclase
MNLNTLQLIVIAVVAVVVAVAAAAGLTTWFIVRTLRTRRRRKREEEARRREEEEGLDLFGPSGVMALAATIEGVKFATQFAGMAAEVSRQGIAPVVAGSLRRLADIAEIDRPSLRRVVSDDGTVTLMFSDIEGSTALNHRLGDEGWLELLQDHNEIVRRRVKAHRGQVVKTQGDSFMVAFKEVKPALECAVEVQQALENEVLGHDTQIRVRIGLHCGEVTRQGRDVFGLNVALAARVASEARGGEILVSSAAHKLARDAHSVRFGRARTVQLKGISDAARVYPVEWRVS